MNIINKLSVFFPAVNEAENIENTVTKAIKVLDDLRLEYEIIIVEDGSRDKTGEIADRLSKENNKVRVVRHSKNLGYGSALKTGFKNAKYDWVAFTDSDGQFDFSEIKLLLDKSDNAEVILGYRLKRADSYLRKIYTFGWTALANMLLWLNVKDYSCGFKLIKRQVFEKVQPLEGEEKVTQIEFLVKARRLGYKFAEVGVHHYPRVYGKPTGAKLSVVIKSLFDIFKLWWKIKEDKLAFSLIISILLLATVLRFFRLPDYMTFLGDEGRDALVVKDLLVNQNIPFIGPPTSVGNIYLGPLYYYMMAFSMAAFWLNPVAAAGMNALIGVLTVGLIYHLAKTWFGKVSALIASFLYAISPVNIIYSRSSWNPNPAPFFALLGIWSLYKAHKTRNFLWLIPTGAFFAAVLQMHYLAIILLPVFGFLWLVEFFKHKKGFFWTGTFGGIIAFWVVMTPLVLFDLKHEFLNLRAILTIFTGNQSVGFNVFEVFLKIPSLFTNNLVGRYMAGENILLSVILSLLIVFPLFFAVLEKVKGKALWPYLVLGVWLGAGLLGLSFYKSSVYDHYLGFLNPVPFILLGASFLTVGRFVKNKVINYLFWAALILVLTLVNLSKNPLLKNPNYQLEKTQEVAKVIIQDANNKPFNFALISKNNYDAAYQFYLDLYGYKPQMIPFEVADQLFVVCEDPTCDPVHNPKYEITGFGWSKIDTEKEFFGVKIYKLIPNPSGQPS